MFKVKLQACSKIVSIVVFGFTLTSGIALYTLNDLENELLLQAAEHNRHVLEARKNELDFYTKRIDDEYYELINGSLSQILSLDSKYLSKDPLLSFFRNNIRNGSGYSSGENLREAVDAMSYFRLPYVMHDFKTGRTEVFNTENEHQKTRLLSLRDKDSNTIPEIIRQRPTLNYGFNMLYFGNGTYLCLTVYDPVLDRNYSILSLYLDVIEHMGLNVRNIIPEVTPLMKETLNGAPAMIVKRNSVIFKTDNFTLQPDLKTFSLKEHTGISIVDKTMRTADGKEGGEELSLLSIGVLKSINSYILLQSPYTLKTPDLKLYNTAKGGIALVALLSMLFIFLRMRRLKKQLIDREADMRRFSGQFSEFDIEDYKDLHNTCSALARKDIEEEKERLLAEKRDAAGDATRQADATSDGEDASDRKKATDGGSDGAANAGAAAPAQGAQGAQDADDAAANEADRKASSDAAEDDGADAHGEEQHKKQSRASRKRDRKARRQQRAAARRENQDSEAGKTENADQDAQSPRASQADRSAQDPQKSAADASRAADADKVGKRDEPETSEAELSEEELSALRLKEKELTLQGMLKEFMRRTPVFTEQDPEYALMRSFFKITENIRDSLHGVYEETETQLRGDLKNRVLLYKKEGQCMAARQFLLNTLPDNDAMPESDFVDFAAFTVPARELTGNFYTIRRLDHDNLVFVMGDCNSTGVRAAYTAAVVTTLLEQAIEKEQTPENILSHVNRGMLSMNMQRMSPVSMFVGIISEKTGNVMAANAGYNPPLIITGSEIRSEGGSESPLGVSIDSVYTRIRWYQAKDDVVILYSPGILNVRNAEDELFGMDRLLKQCESASEHRADEIAIRILSEVKNHKGKRVFRQDVSLICLKQLMIRF